MGVTSRHDRTREVALDLVDDDVVGNCPDQVVSRRNQAELGPGDAIRHPFAELGVDETVVGRCDDQRRDPERRHGLADVGAEDEIPDRGSDGGAVSGSWGQSQIDLSTLADPGDSIRLRFDFGVDGCNGLDGWYVDNVRVCAETVPNQAPDLPALGTVLVEEGGAVDAQLFASDPEGDGIILSGVGLPGFASVLDQGSGTGRLQLRPALGTAASYPANVQALDDGAPPGATLAARLAFFTS